MADATGYVTGDAVAVNVRLQIQPGLDHRGGLDLAGADLAPPAGAFEALGGRPAIARLVDGLYDRIEADSILRPAFRDDLARERELLKLFFEAWFGGATTYFDTQQRHGLRVTHENISISREMADRWVGHFLAAFAETVSDQAVTDRIQPVITRLALALVNRSSDPAPGERLNDSCSVTQRPFLRPIQHDDAASIAAAAKADPGALPRHGSRLLLIAAVQGKARAAEALLRQGVDANSVAVLPGSEASRYRLPALQIAPLCGALAMRHDAVARLLVKHGAQYDIFTAAFVGDANAVGRLLDMAPELANARDPACDVDPVTPLMHAVLAGRLDVARLLLQRGASAAVSSVRLIRGAADAGHEALTALLLEHGAQVDTIGAGDWVLYPAIATGLLARGANVNYRPGAWIGLCCTGNSGHKENVALARGMLDCGADMAARYRGRTALHCAAKAGFARVAEALIEHGADVNALNDAGQTPLDDVEHAAPSIDREPVRRLLVSHGARRGQHRDGRDAAGAGGQIER